MDRFQSSSSGAVCDRLRIVFDQTDGDSAPMALEQLLEQLDEALMQGALLEGALAEGPPSTEALRFPPCAYDEAPAAAEAGRAFGCP